MKKVLLLAVFQVFVLAVMAVPAHPKPVKVQQPDGSFVTIRLHGDEWMHFTTTEDGYSVVKDQRGYYVYADLKGGKLEATTQVAHDFKQRSATEKAFLTSVGKYQAPAMKAEKTVEKNRVQQQQRRALASRRATNYSNFRGLVILVQFTDKTFSRTDYPTIANNMLNKKNYTGYDREVYTGSVRDYFSDNSGGLFQPQFDVVGPITVSYSQYDGNDYSLEITNAAIDAVDNQVNFSIYDGDNDGVVDLVYFIIAGNGSNYSGNNSGLWWPHRSCILEEENGSYYYKYADGVQLWDYASSVELCGWTSDPGSVIIDGIGTICHEFSHVLGLPDFYDADYAKSGGQSNHPDGWSVMAGGSYNNNGRTPVGYSLYERYSVGFTAQPTKITAKGAYTLEPLYLNQKGYRIDSPVANEFFLLENRQQSAFKWDQYLPGSGMLVHRVDQTNMSIWNSNAVNCDPSHNYYEVVWAGGVENCNSQYDVFPGAGNVTELDNNTTPANLKTWSGEETIWGLYSIQENGSNITFTVNPSGDGPVKPTDVAVSNVTATSATVTWVGTNDNYNVHYRIQKALKYDFESAEPWAVDDFPPFTTYDGDKRPVYNIGLDFTNKQYTGSLIAFQNGMSGNFAAHSGNAFGCFVAATPYGSVTSNNDFFITPEVEITPGMVFSFWARSATSNYGLERFKVGVYGNTPGTFSSYLAGSATTYKEAPTSWTQYTYDLSAYVGQTIRLAINCVSQDAFAFFIDDIYLGNPNDSSWDVTIENVTTPCVLKNLTPQTEYEVQVQAKTTDGTSDWSSSIFFTTLELSVIPGDANGDGNVTFIDVVAIVNYLLGKPGGSFVLDGADFNGDGKVTISDAVGLLYYLKVQ